MIYALSLNPCLDKSARIARFAPDAPNRIRVERTDVGGKGVNVARALHALAGTGTLVSLDFEGEPVKAAMAAEGLTGICLPLPGQLRVNLKLRDEAAGRTIEINESGPEVHPEALRAMEDRLLSLCREGDWVSLSGSLPSGAAQDTYRRLCRRLNAQGCQVAADCDGTALALAIQAHPALIKPNAGEFQALTGVDPADTDAAVEACRGLIRQGVGRVCLSRGAEGALLVSARGAWRCPAADVPVRGLQGAGDSMLAALMLALARGDAEPIALRYASAAARASVMRPGTLLCRREDVERLLPTMPEAIQSLPERSG
ncbi:MAG: hexose kinase [Clostridia bacterium]|nr:hexose kinase [Clostridia bacterium]